MFESHHGLSLIMPLVILLAVLYLVYKLISYTRGMRNEAFENAVATRPYDIGSFLAARTEYDNFYQSEGKQLCKAAAGAEEPLCSLYGGVIGPAYSYSPPALAATANLSDETFAPITVETSPAFQLESGVFTYYRAVPVRAGNDRPPSFRTADEWQTKTDVERFIDERLGIYRASAGSGTAVTAADYITYITIGGLNYKVVKDFGSGTQDVLAVSKQDATSRRPIVLYVACGIRAPSTYRQAGVINDTKLFELMVTADSQNKLDGDLSAAAAAAVGAVAGSASAAAPAGTAANLQLPPLRYVEDAWIKNAALFKQMFDTIKTPARTIANYFNGTNIANTNNTYVNTLQKFVELDRRILRAAGPTGRPQAGYKFLIPNAYDPALQLFDDNYEPPAEPAKHMKCYDLTAQENSLVNYFRRGRGNVENPGVSPEQLASKVQAAICASYGYYTAATAEGVCNCTGCCIPVAYKPRDGRAAAPASRRGAAAAADEASEEILSKVDNCVHIAQPFQILRPGPIIRLAPTCGGGAAGLQTEEGFVGQSEIVQMPANYGLTRGFSDIRNLVAATKGAIIGGRDMNM
jgi:hypothetical protein